jgi:hypothetical protein
VRYSLRLLEQDCYDEQAHLDLMQIQLDADHHGEALRRYRIYVRRMTELGIEPRPFPHPGLHPAALVSGPNCSTTAPDNPPGSRVVAAVPATDLPFAVLT